MQELTYPRERALGTIALVIGALLWLLLVAGTFGIALLVLAGGFVAYLFAHSSLIAHIKGNGVELSQAQFPDLHQHFQACCDRLQMQRRPEAYVLNGNGSLNAFATKFLGRQYVVLHSEVVDAMQAQADGIRFYIGHELGHLRAWHWFAQLLRWPALWLPLLGAAYSRARESTCDRHGAACCGTPETAARALVALAAGPERWQQVDLPAYRRQAGHTSGFWMSFHELLSGYPWTIKRALRVLEPATPVPGRSTLAYVPAAVVPYAGRLGSGIGFLALVYVIGVLAAVALPAYKDYQARAKFSAVFMQTQDARDKLAAFYEARNEVPESLEKAGIAPQQAGGTQLSLDNDKMVLTVETPQGELVFTPSVQGGRIIWSCAGGENARPAVLPPACR